MKNNSKSLSGYSGDVIWPFVLILPKMSGYVRTFKNKDGHKDENKNKKFMSFSINDDTLLKKYKTIWAKIEDLVNLELNGLFVFNDR